MIEAVKLQAEITELRAALLEASGVARESVMAIEALYASLTTAVGAAQPAMAHAHAMIAKWEALAKGKP